jgi:hypothetical protein
MLFFNYILEERMSFVSLIKRYFSGKRANTEAGLGQLTVVSLKAMAKERGLVGYSRLNKAGLIKLLG